MDVFGYDALIGNYRLSDHGLMLATFSYSDTYPIGLGYETNRVFLGTNPKSVYLGSKPNSVLEITMTVIQNELVTHKVDFSINECREIIGRITGYQGYKKLYLNDEKNLENVYYNVIVNNCEYEKSGDRIVGIRFNMECDSMFCWVDDEIEYVTSGNDETIHVKNNSDLFYEYNYPVMILSSDQDVDGLEITNLSDNGRSTMIDHVVGGEVITIDSGLSKITSTIGTNFSEIFNYKFPRLIRGYNEILVSYPMHVTCKLTLPRKMGVL